MNDYPRVLYHTAIEHPRDRFGKLIEGAPARHMGDLVSPNYPIPNVVANEQGFHGKKLGQDSDHMIPQHHYKTMIVAVYSSGLLDESASKIEEERLATEGWVRHPDLLKEEYDED